MGVEGIVHIQLLFPIDFHSIEKKTLCKSMYYATAGELFFNVTFHVSLFSQYIVFNTQYSCVLQYIFFSYIVAFIWNY